MSGVFSTIILPVLVAVMGVLFLLACLGEKKLDHKIVYASVALILLIGLLLSR